MNYCAKFIAIFGLLALSMSSYAAPIDTNNQQPTEPVTLTLGDVCAMMGADAITIATMYKEGKTHQDVAAFIEKRNDEEPAFVFAMPGVLKSLYLIHTFKLEAGELYNQPNFPEAMGIVAHDICMKERAEGWVQEVPGRAKMIKQKPPGIQI